VANGADQLEFIVRNGGLKLLSRAERTKLRRAWRGIASGAARVKDRQFINWCVKVTLTPRLAKKWGPPVSDPHEFHECAADMPASPSKCNVRRDGARIPRRSVT
jgi:hypothetical protein